MPANSYIFGDYVFDLAPPPSKMHDVTLRCPKVDEHECLLQEQPHLTLHKQAFTFLVVDFYVHCVV